MLSLRGDIHLCCCGLALSFPPSAETLGRLFGDRLVDRFGPQAVVRFGGALAAVGFGLGLVVAQPVAAIIGFACLGAGMSGVVPIIFRASGHVPGMAAGVGLAAASSMGYLGFLVGPPTIGGLAELTGLPTALILLVALAGTVALLAPTTRYARSSAGLGREPQPVVA